MAGSTPSAAELWMPAPVMEKELSNPSEERRLLIDVLISASKVDLPCTDRYLNRAEALLQGLCTRQQYREIQQDHERLSRLTDELRQACARQEWANVRALASEATKVRQRVTASAPILSTADAVYGPTPFRADPIALGLSGIVAQPDGVLMRASSEMTKRLEWLADQDPEWAGFYHSRRRHFETLPAGGGRDGAQDPGLLQQRIATAIEQGRFAEIENLTRSVLSEGKDGSTRLWIPGVAEEQLEKLASAFPQSAVEHARRMGLAEVLLPPAKSLGDYVSCCGAEEQRASISGLPTESLASDETRHSRRTRTLDVGPKLLESLDFLVAHPVITSTGVRYLPWFGAEAILVEDFPEQQAGANPGVLEALGLPARRGVPRLQIEDALLHRGAEFCRILGLNSTEYLVVCVPFDAYQRLAPRYGWGQADLWTHLDGYQVTRELKLLALVGGYARFGGPDDLSAISRSYDSDKIVARFAVVRRDRFFARREGPSL